MNLNELDVRQANAGKMPASRRREKISIGSPDMRGRRDHRTATQNHLVAHEFSVVLAQCAGDCAITGIAEVSTLGPLPHIAEHLRRTLRGGVGQRLGMQFAAIEQVSGGRRKSLRGDFPLGFGGETLAGPVSKRVGFKVAHVADRRLQ